MLLSKLQTPPNLHPHAAGTYIHWGIARGIYLEQNTPFHPILVLTQNQLYKRSVLTRIRISVPSKLKACALHKQRLIY